MSRSGHLVVVPFNGRGTEFAAGHSKELFAFDIRGRRLANSMLGYAVSRDGARFFFENTQ